MPLSCVYPEGPVRYLCQITGSVRHIIQAEHIRRGLVVSNWGAMASKAVAELALLLTIGCMRKLAQHTHRMNCERGWNPFTDHGCTLFGKKVGIYGYGRIARELIKLLEPFGVDLRVYSRGVPEEVFRRDGVRTCPDLDALFRHCDALIVAEGLTEGTVGSIGARQLGLLPDGATFVNISRAPIVEEETLCKEALSGRLQIALDVYYEEPLPPEWPLRGLKNVILSPHIGGPTFEQRPACGKLAMENILRFAQKQPVLNLIDLPRFHMST
jgi:phosphoglycerate dehydrogenase-like enzyme